MGDQEHGSLYYSQVQGELAFSCRRYMAKARSHECGMIPWLNGLWLRKPGGQARVKPAEGRLQDWLPHCLGTGLRRRSALADQIRKQIFGLVNWYGIGDGDRGSAAAVFLIKRRAFVG